MSLFLIALVLFPILWVLEALTNGTKSAEKEMHSSFGTGIAGFVFIFGGLFFLVIVLVALGTF